MDGYLVHSKIHITTNSYLVFGMYKEIPRVAIVPDDRYSMNFFGYRRILIGRSSRPQ